MSNVAIEFIPVGFSRLKNTSAEEQKSSQKVKLLITSLRLLFTDSQMTTDKILLTGNPNSLIYSEA